MNVVSAGLAALEGNQTFLNLLGRGPFPVTEWLFREELGAVIEGTSKVAVVVRGAGSYRSPNAHNTMRFPRLMIEIWADPARRNGAVEVKDAEEKIRAVYDQVFNTLHRPQGGSVVWGGEIVLDSIALDSEVDFYPVADGGGMVRGVAYFGLTII